MINKKKQKNKTNNIKKKANQKRKAKILKYQVMQQDL